MAGKKEVRPWDLLNPKSEIASKKVYDNRLSICKSCPNFRKLTKQCKICKCIMPAKAKLADARCPIGKWVATKETSDGSDF